MAEVEAQREVPSEEEIEMAGSGERVAPLDPDFILILFYAILGDAIGAVIIILGILDFYTVTTLVNILVNIFFFVPISIWLYWRTNRIAQSKKTKIEELQKRTRQLAKTAPRIAQQLEKATARIGARVATRLLLKVAIRGLAAFAGSVTPFIGLIPFWSITVLLTLREK